MLDLALRMLRHHRSANVATFLALLVGTAIVMACGGLMETGLRGDADPKRLVRADVVVVGDRSYRPPVERSAASEGELGESFAADLEGFGETVVLPERVPVDDRAAGAVRSVGGAGAVVAEHTVEAALLDGAKGAAELTGLGWSSAALTPYELVPGGRAPGASGEVVLDARTARAQGVRAGDEVRIAARGTSDVYRVSGLAEPAAGDAPEGTAFFTDAHAAALSPAVSAVAVVAADGTDPGALADRIADALGGLSGAAPVTVLTGGERGQAEDLSVLSSGTNLIALAGSFGGLVTMIAVFTVSATIGLSVRQRQREFALLRATGGTPGQLRRMLLGETLLVAVPAAALAMVAGPLLGEWLYGRLVGLGMASDAVGYRLGWLPAVAAAGALLLTAVLGGWLGARRAVRVRPVEALAEASLQRRWAGPWRIGSGIVCLIVPVVLGVLSLVLGQGMVGAVAAGPAVFVMVVGLALLGPAVTRWALRLLDGPVRLLTGVGGGLALLNAHARRIRMAAVVVPVMLATGVTVGNVYIQTTQVQAGKDAFTRNLRADAVVGTAAGGVTPELLESVRRVEGVAAAGAYVTTVGHVEKPLPGELDELTTGMGELPLQGVSPEAAERTTAVTVTEGSLAELRGRTVALPEVVAGSMERGVGDTIRVRLGDRAAVDLEIVALFENRRGGQAALAPAGLLAGHTTGGQPQQILVRTAEGVPDERITANLAALAEDHPGLVVADRAALIEENTRQLETQAWVNYLAAAMIAGYTALAFVNTLVVSVNDRRREFGLQRLSGATRAQVLRMMTVEALLTVAIGAGLGTVAALTSLVPFSFALTGSPVPAGPVWVYGLVVGTAAVLTLAATLVPTWKALRVRPAAAAAVAD
ncbi:FtsX-like permease family protein [Streptomyces sp. TRM 70361]|uniref:ABC transporter permease n=1 Tax=Streptomyces sp. TRM 70361 TaxID=3116553 RepID=UPI002E7B3E3E|nr:FtsX-like permease family protein [Streptomyces sp. TRM 70361]MEE1942423.1 FtsX-like permease family protein [Streptomyces sp. TRM 70361]